jgi:hypothetical protein
MAKSKSCRCCGSKKKCSGAHVYAVELKPEAIDDKQFRIDAGIDKCFKGRCFYVGQTRQHSVECRYYNQHRAKKRTRKKPGATFDCTCKTGLVRAVKYGAYNRGNRYVRKYAKGLAYELFAHLNPLPKKSDPTVAEAALAESLRSQGFAVHYN